MCNIQVHLYEGDNFHSNLVTSSGDYGSSWTWQCVMLPSGIDRTAEIKIKFRAVRGRSGTADIGVDDVTLGTEECPRMYLNRNKQTVKQMTNLMTFIYLTFTPE